MIHHKPTVVDLCCGAGGFSEGFSQAGFDIILGVDFWSDALQSFQQNHHCEVLESDIRLISDLPDCDVIIGSPPCQNLSKVSRNKNYAKGLELISVFEQLVKEINPDYWVWENVEVVKHFYPSASILNSWDFGLPQRRKRAFVSNFSFFRMNYLPGILTEPLQYSGAKADNTSPSAKRHTVRSGTVRTKRIRNVRTGQHLSMEATKSLMGFPINYKFFGKITSIQTQIGNAVCPPVSKTIAEAILNDML